MHVMYVSPGKGKNRFFLFSSIARRGFGGCLGPGILIPRCNSDLGISLVIISSCMKKEEGKRKRKKRDEHMDGLTPCERSTRKKD
jgi:hypothetical protein